jgi:hypothetical protein
MTTTERLHPRITRKAEGEYRVDGALTDDVLRCLSGLQDIDELAVFNSPRMTTAIAKRLLELSSPRRLWLWCGVSRIALNHLLRIPGLEVLDILDVCKPGRLSGFECATSLHTFRANCWLTAEDVHAIARCTTLRELGLQKARLDRKALDALLSLPFLCALDLERTPFDDAMARQAARSSTLTSLELGATRITRRGLESLVRMPNLRRLDVWATRLTTDDLDLLREASALEWISIGDYRDSPLPGDRIVPILLSMPALKNAWLDGVTLTPDQRTLLESRLPQVRIS